MYLVKPAGFILTLIFFLYLGQPAFATISFIIDSPIVNGTEIGLSASISGLTTNSCNSDGRCFLQGTLRLVGASKYFGSTQNKTNSWIDYQSSPETEYIQNNFFDFTPNSGSWSGQLKLNFSVLDTEYKGPGDYEIKVRRFSGKSQNPSGDSNTLISRLDQTIPTPTPTPTSTPTSSPTPTPTQTPTPTPSAATPTPTPTLKPTLKKTPTQTPSEASPTEVLTKGGSPSATPTIETTPEVLSASVSATSSNLIPVISTFIGVLASSLILILRFFNSKGKIA